MTSSVKHLLRLGFAVEQLWIPIPDSPSIQARANTTSSTYSTDDTSACRQTGHRVRYHFARSESRYSFSFDAATPSQRHAPSVRCISLP